MLIQVIGARGTLGRAVVRAAELRGHQVISTSLDITHVTPLDIVAPVVINCAGLVKQRKASDARFMLVNGYGPHLLAEVCDTVPARLIHVSTDCVFTHPGPHHEDDITSGSDVYARSKRAGEVVRDPHLTVRTSFIGSGMRGLINELQHMPFVRASSNLLWSGHTVDTVADCLITLIDREEITGILHIPGTYQTRLELVQKLVDYLGLSIDVIEDNRFVQDRRLGSKRWGAFNLPYPAPFDEQLTRMEWL